MRAITEKKLKVDYMKYKSHLMNSMQFTDNILSHTKVYETHLCYLFQVSRGLSVIDTCISLFGKTHTMSTQPLEILPVLHIEDQKQSYLSWTAAECPHQISL